VEQIERMPLGASTVVRYRHDAAMVDATARLVREFGISGLAGTEFLQAGDTAHVIEINRRVTPGLHRAPSIGIDYLRTWADALAGRAPARRAVMDEAASRVFVHFPMEWMRDPMSPYLVYQPLDAPRDDPRLLAALLDLGWKVNRLRDTA
jgi:predicted ATP-grasp superfamily ATP-dependent carboligase